MKTKSYIVVGVHVGHDRSVSVVKNGELIGHIAEERLDRVKHSSSVNFPRKALYSLLRFLKIDMYDIDTFVLTYAFVNIDRIIENLAQDFRDEFALPHANVIGVSHHLAHAYSTFYTSPFNESLILIADGAGDLTESEKLESETAYIASSKGISLLWERTQEIPYSYAERRNFFHPDYILDQDKDKQISLARKYEQITYSIGFKWGQAGKTMGLAPFGKKISNVPNRKLQNDDFVDLRIKDLIYDFKSKAEKQNLYYKNFLIKRRADIAATGQLVIEKIVLDLLKNLSYKTQIRNLCLAGGLFLNCVINDKIARYSDFKKIHICPAAGDDGQSIGAAFYGYYKSNQKSIQKNNDFTPFLGLSYEEDEIKTLLRKLGYKYQKASKKKIVNLLCAGMIGGVLRGRSEVGPRALGHRSILAAPFSNETKEHLNRYVKQRETFRPFAPIVTSEDQFTYFELPHKSPFMLFCSPIKKEFRKQLKAVAHIDSSARVQAVDKKQTPYIHSLLLEMKKQSGFPILLNTSFNSAGEPIVETPRDAILAFERMNLDFLVIENYLIPPEGWPNVPQADSRWMAQ